MTTTVQRHRKIPEKPVVTTNNGLFLVLEATVQNQHNLRSNASLYRPVVVLRPGRPEVRILLVRPGGFEQPVPRALRPVGQKRPGGAFLGRGLANSFGHTKKRIAMYFCNVLFVLMLFWF